MNRIGGCLTRRARLRRNADQHCIHPVIGQHRSHGGLDAGRIGICVKVHRIDWRAAARDQCIQGGDRCVRQNSQFKLPANRCVGCNHAQAIAIGQDRQP